MTENVSKIFFEYAVRACRQENEWDSLDARHLHENIFTKSHMIENRKVCNECKCIYNELKIIWRLHLLRFGYLVQFCEALFVGWMSPQRKHCSRIRPRTIFPISPKMFWNFFEAKTCVSVDLGAFKGSCCELEWPWTSAECQPGEPFCHFCEHGIN